MMKMGSKTNARKEGAASSENRAVIILSRVKIPIGTKIRITTVEQEAKVIEKILEDFPKKGQKSLTEQDRKKTARQAVGLDR